MGDGRVRIIGGRRVLCSTGALELRCPTAAPPTCCAVHNAAATQWAAYSDSALLDATWTFNNGVAVVSGDITWIGGTAGEQADALSVLNTALTGPVSNMTGSCYLPGTPVMTTFTWRFGGYWGGLTVTNRHAWIIEADAVGASGSGHSATNALFTNEHDDTLASPWQINWPQTSPQTASACGCTATASAYVELGYTDPDPYGPPPYQIYTMIGYAMLPLRFTLTVHNNKCCATASGGMYTGSESCSSSQSSGQCPLGAVPIAGGVCGSCGDHRGAAEIVASGPASMEALLRDGLT